MQPFPARRRLRADVRPASTYSQRAEVLAIYGAFTLIAVVVFGTISYHPF